MCKMVCNGVYGDATIGKAVDAKSGEFRGAARARHF